MLKPQGAARTPRLETNYNIKRSFDRDHLSRTRAESSRFLPCWDHFVPVLI